MKRTLWTILLAAMLLFAACAPKAGPLTLPDGDDVTEVRLEYGGESVVRAGPGWIGMLLEDLAAVHFVLEDGSEQTLFVYPEKDKWYIERPYEGVYETDQLLWVMVTDLSE